MAPLGGGGIGELVALAPANNEANPFPKTGFCATDPPKKQK